MAHAIRTAPRRPNPVPIRKQEANTLNACTHSLMSGVFAIKIFVGKTADMFTFFIAER